MTEGDAVTPLQVRFCQQCARSLVPFDTPHVSRPCADCGKTAFFANPGPDGVGIQVEKGDSFSIPAGWLTMSLDPAKSRGTFSKSGLNWFVELLLARKMPTSADGMVQFFKELDKEADEIFLNSSLMPGIDVKSAADMTRVFEKFKEERDTVEWHALVMNIWADKGREILSGEGSREDVAFAATRAMAAYFMLIYKQNLESPVWEGYQQTQLVYNVAKAGAATPAEAKAIEALRPAFGNLSEEVLAAWVGSGADIAQKFGIAGIENEVVNALAGWHLARFDRERQQDAMLKDGRSKRWSNIIAAATAGAAVATAIIVILAYFGVFKSSPHGPSNKPNPVSSSVSPSSLPSQS